jgi:hypothetical protein
MGFFGLSFHLAFLQTLHTIYTLHTLASCYKIVNTNHLPLAKSWTSFMNEPFCIRYKILLIKEELKYLE